MLQALRVGDTVGTLLVESAPAFSAAAYDPEATFTIFRGTGSGFTAEDEVGNPLLEARGLVEAEGGDCENDLWVPLVGVELALPPILDLGTARLTSTTFPSMECSFLAHTTSTPRSDSKTMKPKPLDL